MDIVLVPSTLNLTSRLSRLTPGGTGGAELLQTNTEWSYSIPPLNRDEFSFEGTLVDSTPPTLTTPLPNFGSLDSNRGCFVRQLPERDYENPALEVLFDAIDAESVVDLTLEVGTFENADDVITGINLGAGKGGGGAVGGVTIYNGLVPAVELFFTVTATNQNGLRTSGGCGFPESHAYDRSPPLARINPIATVSSHPTQIRALLVLFDEFGLSEVQELAVGRVRGQQGTDALPWQPFNTSLINTPPADNGNVMTRYSFGRVSG